uniref:Uncharacterized protein n=1 Tax=Oryza barthii TaxID=65489 RepID=A0A0D3G1Q3_9ORYZ
MAMQVSKKSRLAAPSALLLLLVVAALLPPPRAEAGHDGAGGDDEPPPTPERSEVVSGSLPWRKHMNTLNARDANARLLFPL